MVIGEQNKIPLIGLLNGRPRVHGLLTINKY